MSFNADSLAAIPKSLKDVPRWLLWRLEERDGKPTKVPIDPTTGRHAAVNRPATWTTFDVAANAMQSGVVRAVGLGFVFNGDGIVGVDLDKCRDATTGAIEEWAQEIVRALNSYSELSPSGTGIHLIATGEIPAGAKRKGRVEMYSTGRFFTMTGQHLADTPSTIESRSEALAAIHAQHVAVPDAGTSRDGAREQSGSGHHTALVEAATRYVGRAAGVNEGARNNTAFSLAGHLAAFELKGTGEKLSESEVLTLLQSWNLRNRPPLGTQALQQAVHSAMVSGTPRRPHVVDERRFKSKNDERANASSTDRRATRVAAFVPFPVDVLPEPLRAFVLGVAVALPCDPAYVALPLLAACASAIGNARVIRIKGGWTEPSVLWAAVVGQSGTLKSPALAIALNAIFDVQSAALHEYAEAMEHYEVDKLEYEKKLAAWKRSPSGEVPEKPDKPIAARFVTSDVTVESLALLLRDGPRGLLLFRDELGGWLKSFDAYRAGRGGDAQKYLEMHRAGKLLVDRKSGPENEKILFVPHAAVSIAGGIQPGSLRRALSKEYFEIGLAARLLLAMPPRRAKRWTDAEIAESLEAVVAVLFSRLRALDMLLDDDEAPRPTPVDLDLDARNKFIEFYNAHNAEQAELDGDLAAAWAKIEGYAARFALIIHLVRVAAEDPSLRNPDLVDGTSMDAAITLARWFASEARRVYAFLGEGEDERARRELVELIGSKGGSVTVRDLMRASRRFATAEDAEMALADLVETGLATREFDDHDGQGGRPVERFRLVESDTTPVGSQDGEDLSASAADADLHSAPMEDDGDQGNTAAAGETHEPAAADTTRTNPAPREVRSASASQVGPHDASVGGAGGVGHRAPHLPAQKDTTPDGRSIPEDVSASAPRSTASSPARTDEVLADGRTTDEAARGLADNDTTGENPPADRVESASAPNADPKRGATEPGPYRPLPRRPLPRGVHSETRTDAADADTTVEISEAVGDVSARAPSHTPDARIDGQAVDDSERLTHRQTSTADADTTHPIREESEDLSPTAPPEGHPAPDGDDWEEVP
ncbi:MAG: DUF3987 domain-containing protein [Planctomycetes bacterium]|nr:DUF3987 domain-containing protein [Planctomycetota bacterium]